MLTDRIKLSMKPPQEAMANDPVRLLLLKMAGPSVIAMLMQALYNTVDSMYVSRISDGSLAAVTIAFPVQMIMGALSTGIGVGINSSISRALGAKDTESASKSAANGLMIGLLTVAVMILFGLFGAQPFVSMYTDDPEVLVAGTIYVRTICLLGFGSIFSQLGFSVLQGSGNMIFPMMSQLCGGLAVILIDPLLIFGLDMGVLGAAVASSMAQTISMLIGFYGIFVANKSNLPVSFRGFRPDIAIIKDIMYVGIPAALTQATTSIVAGIITKEIAAYGTSAIAVYGAYNKLSTFASLPVFGITRGMNPILGYCVGARNKSRFNETEKAAAIIANTWTFVAFCIFAIFPRYLLMSMHATPEMMEIGIKSFRLLCLSLLFLGSSIVMVQIFAPLKKAQISMASAFLRQLVFLVPLTMMLSKIWGLYGIWIGMFLADLLNYLFVFAMNIWVRKKVFPTWDLPESSAETEMKGV